MIKTLQSICQLQPHYSPDNTPEMRERGRLIRQVLTADIGEVAPALRSALGVFGPEFGINASDGIGRKTEAPWVRFFAQSMSPDPRHGFYVVIHFAADGSAVFVTIGCGATNWANGELRSLSDEELHRKTEWAREVITQRFGSIQPFTDQIDLGARAPLPKAFEKATAVAKKLLVTDLDEHEVRDLLVQAAERLTAVYEAQRIGRDLSTADIAQIELQQIARPTRKTGQGFRMSHEERVAIELRAMDVAKEWLESEGYIVKDTSRTSPFDFQAAKGQASLKVEVKGTTTDGTESVFMTANEVTLHRSEKGNTALFLVSQIIIQRADGQVVAKEGVLTPMIGWDIDLWEAVPIAYQLRRRTAK